MHLMKPSNQKLIPRFGPAKRFAWDPLPPPSYRAAQEAQFVLLKTRLVAAALRAAPDPDLHAPLRRAATDAEALAWATPYPALFFPALLEEKAAEARRQAQRQAQLRRHSREWLTLAV